MFSAPEAKAVTSPYLEPVRQAGAEYAGFGRVSDALMAKLAVPMIPDETYAAICNGNT